MSSLSSPLNRLIRELRRRRVFKTAGIYIFGTWLLLQLADVVFPGLGIPEEAIRYVLMAALAGFPVALVFGWYFDIDSRGIVRTAPAEPEELERKQPLGRSDFLILGGLALMVGAILYGMLGNVAPPQAEPDRSDGPPMVAVLPFTSASRGGDSEFFAYGIHDDLLTQLAQLQSLRVISRTSVLEYQDVTHNIREIGRELGADAILEGGVQSAGNRIRINAQLIDARTDEHLWAETFDRELTATNIFEVQSEISRAIAAAMNASLTQQETDRLSIIPTENMSAYRAFRKALQIREEKGTWLVEEFAESLEEAIRLDPEFTLAMAELVGYLGHANFYYEFNPELTERAEELLRQIHQLAPGSTEELFARSYYSYYGLRDYDTALAFVDQAIQLSPSEMSLWHLKTWIQRRQGDFDGRIETLRQIQILDPRDHQYAAGMINELVMAKRFEEASAELERMTFENDHLAWFRSMLAYREHRDFERFQREQLALTGDGSQADYEFLWELHIDRRDFVAANQVALKLEKDNRGPIPFIDSRLERQTFSAHFLEDQARLDQLLDEAQVIVDSTMDENGKPLHWTGNFNLAFISAFRGSAEDTEYFIRIYLRELDSDLAAKPGHWHTACRVLGLASAINATVECLRDVVSGRSIAYSFIEPYTPFYDSVRNEPAFIQMMTDLGEPLLGSE